MIKQIEAYHLLHQGTLALARAERNGIRVDMNYLQSAHNHLTRRIAYMEKKFTESLFYMQWKNSLATGKEPNLNSNAQLSKFLYKVKKLKPPKLTNGGEGSTDKESLLDLDIQELHQLLEIRKLKKIRDTYLEGFMKEQVDGWLHPVFNLHLVKTFRSSSDRPNFQNIPKRDKEAMQITRRALFPREGHQLLEVDYSGLEVRIATCYHQDPTMIKYLNTGYDMHADMAKQIFLINDFDKTRPEHAYLRSATKNGFVFPQFYGDYWRNCAEYIAYNWGNLPHRKWKDSEGVPIGNDQTLGSHFRNNGINSIVDFEKHIQGIEKDMWGKRFPVYFRWKEQWYHRYQKTGYIDSLTGFRYSGVMSKNDCINYPIQGSAFHCLLWSLVHLDQYLYNHGYDSRIVGQIHDSIVLDIHPDELEDVVRLIRKITTDELLSNWKWIIVPLEVEFEICDVDASWADKKELNFFLNILGL